MDESILTVENLSCGYGAHTVLHEVSFALKKGELVGILGPNGSGKTTLVRVLTKVIPLNSGKVFFEGVNINSISHKDFATRVAVINQIVASIPGIKVQEYVALGRIPHLKRWQFFENEHDTHVVRESLEKVKMQAYAHKYLCALSGGERQMVDVARALAQEPSLLLLDEPTSHLDIAHQVALLDLLKTFNREYKLTVMAVLHDINLASEYCERIIMLRGGKVVQQGTPQGVLTFEHVESAYDTVVVVGPHPVSKKPVVYIVPEHEKKRR